MDVYVLKVFVNLTENSSDIFYHRLSVDCCLNTFKLKLAERYDVLKHCCFKVTWIDDDGDRINILDEDDFSIFLEMKRTTVIVQVDYNSIEKPTRKDFPIVSTDAVGSNLNTVPDSVGVDLEKNRQSRCYRLLLMRKQQRQRQLQNQQQTEFKSCQFPNRNEITQNSMFGQAGPPIQFPTTEVSEKSDDEEDNRKSLVSSKENEEISRILSITSSEEQQTQMKKSSDEDLIKIPVVSNESFSPVVTKISNGCNEKQTLSSISLLTVDENSANVLERQNSIYSEEIKILKKHSLEASKNGQKELEQNIVKIPVLSKYITFSIDNGSLDVEENRETRKSDSNDISSSDEGKIGLTRKSDSDDSSSDEEEIGLPENRETRKSDSDDSSSDEEEIGLPENRETRKSDSDDSSSDEEEIDTVEDRVTKASREFSIDESDSSSSFEVIQYHSFSSTP